MKKVTRALLPILALFFALVVVVSMALWPASLSAAAYNKFWVDASLLEDDPPKYASIQAAIDAAGVGDRVYVLPGIYEENISIDSSKSKLVLWGQSRTQVQVIAQNSSNPTIKILADTVTVRQLTIIGGNPGVLWQGVSYGTIENCDISGSNGVGLLLDTITNQTVQCCHVHHNTYGDGIQVNDSELKDIMSNHTHHNGNAGISLLSSDSIAVAYNDSYDNAYGIYLDSASDNNDIYDNLFHDNTVANIYAEPVDDNNWGTPPNPAPVPPCTEQSPPSPPAPTPTPPPPFPLPEGSCFIATAAYGSHLDSHVDTLRSFRDEYLMTNPVGSALVSVYYKLSPPVADFIDEHPALKPIVRVGLLPAVAMSTVAVNTTPAEKIAIVGSLALISILLTMWRRQRSRRLGRS